MQIPTSKITSFLLGFGLLYATHAVFADMPAPASVIDRRVHSVEIGGGAQDEDGTGVSIGNQGDITIVHTPTNSLITGNPETNAMEIVSDPAGLIAKSLHSPVIGITNYISTEGDPISSDKNSPLYLGGSGTYGAAGVVGEIFDIDTMRFTGPELSSIKGYLGYNKYTQGNVDGESALSIAHTGNSVGNRIKPYAFYTTQNSYLGGDVIFNDTILNPDNDTINFFGDVSVGGATTVSGDTRTSYTSMDTTSLDSHYVHTTSSTTNANLALGAIFGTTSTCPADSIVIGCSGHITTANNNAGNSIAPYRGEYIIRPGLGGQCQSMARNDVPTTAFTLYSTAYCFKP